MINFLYLCSFWSHASHCAFALSICLPPPWTHSSRPLSSSFARTLVTNCANLFYALNAKRARPAKWLKITTQRESLLSPPSIVNKRSCCHPIFLFNRCSLLPWTVGPPTNSLTHSVVSWEMRKLASISKS